MLKFYNYDIVCQEIPDEVTLAVNISGCPNHCKGCHSMWLWDDVGETLDENNLDMLIEKYRYAVTCVCFMGGDAEPQTVEKLSRHLHSSWPTLKTGWYSGKENLPENVSIKSFDFIKLGPYIESLGGLKSETTNQRLYKIFPDGKREKIDINNTNRLRN